MADPQNLNQQPQGPKDSHIMPIAEQRRKPVFDPTGRVESINPDEIKIADVRRHPIGLFFIYLQFIFGISLSFILIFAFLPDFLSTFNIAESTGRGAAAVLSVLVVFFGAIFLILATRIYQASQLIITNDNVTQIMQVGLFHRKISEVSMANVEDVTANQKGILQTFFNYGDIHIETAGEQNNYDFIYCPNPNAYAKAIQDARVEFIKLHGK